MHIRDELLTGSFESTVLQEYRQKAHSLNAPRSRTVDLHLAGFTLE